MKVGWLQGRNVRESSLDDILFLVRSIEGIVLFFVHVVMIFIDSQSTKEKKKKIATCPHAMKATKCLRNQLFYYLGPMDVREKLDLPMRSKPFKLAFTQI